jgi:hypothetical protein
MTTVTFAEKDLAIERSAPDSVVSNLPTTGADVLSGDEFNNALDGDAGNDVLDGGDGDDILTGSLGADTATGGLGNDQFFFANVAEGGDAILDLRSGEDRLALDRAGFGLAAAGSLAAAGVSLVRDFAAEKPGPNLVLTAIRSTSTATGRAAARRPSSRSCPAAQRLSGPRRSAPSTGRSPPRATSTATARPT